MARLSKRIQLMVGTLIEQSRNNTPPIDVEDIALNQNITIREDQLGEISGLIFREGNHVIIGVNSDHPETRRRFTIAHELGHFFLHSYNPLFVDKVFAVKLRDHVSSEAIDKEEIEANAFAAELLMPAKMLLEDFQKSQSGILDYEHGDELDKIIEKLARDYKVSKQALTIRLINLGVISEIN